MEEKLAKIVIDGWAGIMTRNVVIIGETKTKFRVKLVDFSIKLPKGKTVHNGDIFLVPKHAVRQ